MLNSWSLDSREILTIIMLTPNGQFEIGFWVEQLTKGITCVTGGLFIKQLLWSPRQNCKGGRVTATQSPMSDLHNVCMLYPVYLCCT